jgi:transposase
VERKWKERYSQKFRCRTVERMNACENILRLSRELGVHRRLLYKWRDQVDPADADGEVTLPNSRESTLRKEISKLKRLLADKTVEVDFFRGALQKVEARRQKSDISGEKASTMKSRTRLRGSLSIERRCQLAQVSRAWRQVLYLPHDYFVLVDQPPGISVSLQVENKQFIGNGHLIGLSLG